MIQKLPFHKRFTYGALLVSGSILGSFVLAEILVRLFFPQTEIIPWQEFHKRYGSFHKKNCTVQVHFNDSDAVMTVKTNSLGLRDREYEFHNETTKRVLLMGDSFTFGYGLNEESIFGTKLEMLLNTRPGKFCVINAGVSNWGTLQEILYAEDRFDLLKPDIVVLTFCGNDSADNDWFLRNSAKGFEGDYSFPGKRFLGRHSHLYRYLRERWRSFRAMRSKSMEKEDRRQGKEEQVVFVDNQTACTYTEEDWRETLEIILGFHRDYMAFNPHGLMLVQATAPWDPVIREKLKSIENGKDLLYVDLYDDTKGIPAPERRLPYDPHWSEKIHELSAEGLYKMIAEQTKNRNNGRLTR